jgi:hypothetical protein
MRKEVGACTKLFENFRENSLKRDLSKGTTANPPRFSLVNTFKFTGIKNVFVREVKLHCQKNCKASLKMHYKNNTDENRYANKTRVHS